MKEISVVVKLYKFSELNEEAKARAIEEEREFLLEATQPEQFDDYQMYQETWNDYNINDEGIIACLEVNEYYFYSNGKLAYTSNIYVNGESKTYFYFDEEEYELEEN